MSSQESFETKLSRSFSPLSVRHEVPSSLRIREKGQMALASPAWHWDSMLSFHCGALLNPRQQSAVLPQSGAALSSTLFRDSH